MNRSGIWIGTIAALALITVVKSCRYDWNPHYLDNDAVEVRKSIYSPDSAAAVVIYTLDIGARGFAECQTLLRKSDFHRDLSKYLLPAEYTMPRWRGNDTLEVVFDEFVGCVIGGPQTNLQLDSDIVTQNGIVIIVVQRKMNKREMLRRGMREIDAGG